MSQAETSDSIHALPDADKKHDIRPPEGPQLPTPCRKTAGKQALAKPNGHRRGRHPPLEGMDESDYDDEPTRGRNTGNSLKRRARSLTISEGSEPVKKRRKTGLFTQVKSAIPHHMLNDPYKRRGRRPFFIPTPSPLGPNWKPPCRSVEAFESDLRELVNLLHTVNNSSTTGNPNPDEEVLCPEDLACRRDGTISLIISLSTELFARAQSLDLVIGGVQDYAEETINEIIRVSQDGAENTKSKVNEDLPPWHLTPALNMIEAPEPPVTIADTETPEPTIIS